MKTLILFLSFLTLNAQAEIYSKFGTGVASQVFIGHQPNDRPTNHIDLDVYINSTSDYHGIQSVIGYEFLCTGDSFPNKEQRVDGTSAKKINMTFPQVTPLYFAQWAGGNQNIKTCNLSWSVATVGTQTSTGTSIGFSVSGDFGDITLNFTSNQTSPVYKKARAANSIFTVLKESDCQ